MYCTCADRATSRQSTATSTAATTVTRRHPRISDIPILRASSVTTHSDNDIASNLYGDSYRDREDGRAVIKPVRGSFDGVVLAPHLKLHRNDEHCQCCNCVLSCRGDEACHGGNIDAGKARNVECCDGNDERCRAQQLRQVSIIYIRVR